MKSVNKFLSGCLVISMAILIFRCEGMDRYYRPDLPEQICAVGMIDIDDTTIYDIGSYWNPRDSLTCSRRINFEKSIQSEYPDEIGNSLIDFSFRISNDKEDMFVYQDNQTTRYLGLILPDSIRFESGTKYYFSASEKEAPDISAECTVPELPPELSLLSLKTGFTILDLPREGCYYWFDMGDYYDKSTFTRRNAEIEFSFPNNDPASYYAILLTGSMSDSRVDWSPGWGSNLLNFEVMESNTNGFLYPLQGRVNVQQHCKATPFYDSEGILLYSYGEQDKLYQQKAYFIDASKIPGANCTLKVSTRWDYRFLVPGFIKCFRIRLMSIPKEASLFYKSLYACEEQSDDPFSEMVNINGNVTGGNGVIAICRSRELIVYTGQTGSNDDPYF